MLQFGGGAGEGAPLLMASKSFHAGRRDSIFVGDRLDRRSLANLAIKSVHGVVTDDDVSIRVDVLASLRMFCARDTDFGLKGFYDHRGVRRAWTSRESDQGRYEQTQKRQSSHGSLSHQCDVPGGFVKADGRRTLRRRPLCFALTRA
jgi:hypothetical protein